MWIHNNIRLIIRYDLILGFTCLPGCTLFQPHIKPNEKCVYRDIFHISWFTHYPRI